AEIRRRHDADARGALRLPRLPRVRGKARHVVRGEEMTREKTMTEAAVAAPPKPKKSVALSGVAAGNTALCTVGRTGNDLAYRGYDILDIAEACEFEEIAYLLVHGKLPTHAELTGYKAHLKSLRGLPEPVKEILERVPAAAHPMDVLRTGVSI